MRQHQLRTLAVLTLTLAGLAVLLWAQAVSAHLPQQRAGADLSAQVPPHQPGGPNGSAGQAAGPQGAVSATPTPCGPSVAGPWTTVAPYPQTIGRYAFAQDASGRFYVIGGVSSGSVVTAVRRYDPATNVWSDLASLPTSAGEAPAAAYYNGKIYVAPGFGVTAFQIYDIAANTWSSGAAYPGQGYGEAAAAYNGHVYVAGGYTGGPSTQSFDYNIATNTWSVNPAAPPTSFFLAGYQQVGQYLYVVGGFSAAPLGGGDGARPAYPPASLLHPAAPQAPAANNTATMRLDMATNTWTSGPAWTPARADFALASNGTTLFAIGGDATGSGYFDSTNQVNELALASWPGGAWSASAPLLPSVRQGNQAGFFGNGAIWSVGGLFGPSCCSWLNETLYRNQTAAPCATGTTTPTPPAVTATPCGTGGTPGPWVVRTPYPFTEYGAGVVSDGTYVYVSGGNTIGGSPHAELYRYDPVADTYTARASAPTQHYLNTVVYGGNGKIYDIAGLNPTAASNLTRIYDIASDTWSTGAVLPASLYDAPGAYYNGKIYVMGGTTGAGALNTLYIYDIAGNSWTTGATLPQAEFAMATGVIGSKIYVAGGSPGSGQLNNLYIYDIPTNAWSSGAAMPTAANFPAGAVVGGKLWVIGGGNPFSQADRPQRGGAAAAPDGSGATGTPRSFDTTQIYDPATNTWTAGPTLSQPRSFFNAATVGNTVVAVGGYNSGIAGSINVTEVNVTTGGTCTTTTPTPTPCGPGTFRVLIVYADSSGPPSALQSAILAEPGVSTVDLFDALAGTPTLAQLQQYNIVVPFSNSPFLDATTLGNNMADYVDGGGVAVQLGFSFYGPGQPYGLNGRWASGNYSPYNYSTSLISSAFTLGSFNAAHPLMQGVTALNSNFQNVVTVAAGATQVAAASNGNSLVAYRPVGAHTTVGITAYIGVAATQSGDWAKVIVNAGRWLAGSGSCATATPTGPTATATATPPCGVGGTPGPWVVRSPAPIDYYGGAATSDGTVAYVAGGYSFSSAQTIDQFSRYNPSTNAWATLSPMPQTATMASAVYAPNVNRVFVFGGQDGASGVSYNITRIYDPGAGTWSTGAVMPDVRAFMASGYSNGKIYLVGGYTNGQVTSSQAQTWEYDPVANTWSTTRADMIQPLGGAASAVVNGHLYVIGGRDGVTAARNQVYDYNIATNTWTARTNMPTGINVPGGAVINGKIWVFGGGSPFRTLTGAKTVSSKAMEAPATTGLTQIYDPAGDTWSSGPSLNQVRSFPAGTNVGNYAVAVGGYTGATTTTSTEVSTNTTAPCGTATATVVTTPTRTPTAGATPTCGGPASNIRILIVHGDTANPPTTLRTQLLALPGVTAVDLFDGQAGTPSLAQLQPYTVVVPMSNFAFADSTTLGNNLADYLDGGGIVVGQTFSWFTGWEIGGRWLSGGYSPWNTTTTANFTDSTLGSFNAGHPLMQGVTTLNAHYRTGQALAAGATNVALFADNVQLIAYKGRAVGVNAYVGNYPYGGTYWSGDFAKVIVNAANWLSAAPCVTPTSPPATATRTNTPVATPTCVSGPSAWRTETPLTVARGYAAGAVVNNQFYVISGFDGASYSPAVERFDPATNTWTSLSPIPTPISQARGAALGTKIYVAGGFNNTFGGQTTGMQIYDTVTGLWSQGAPLPEARAGAGVAAANGKIYIVAGFGPGFATRNTVYEYDPVANTYATRAPVPAAEGNIAVGVLNGLVYAVGGSGSFMHYAYDPVANTWATIANGPTANHQTPGVFALNGELWVVGGTNGFNPYPPNQQVQIYNPGTDSWRFGPAFNIPRYGASAAGTVNGRGYVAAGIDAATNAYLTSMESIGAGTPCGTPTITPTIPPTNTPTSTATNTPPPTNTQTVTPTETGTPPPTITPRPASPSPTTAASPTISPCPIYFEDVPPGDPFYSDVRCLTCRALLSGYPCGSPGEPCIGPGNQPYFRPNNNATRGQIAKILSNAAGYNEFIPSTQQTFEDVLPGSTFWVYIERIAARGFITGYPCGGPFEPCIAPGNRPYFRPYNAVTRGQLAKMDVLTAGFTETPTTQTFEDVPPGSTFYVYIERLAVRGIVQGYPCGGPFEPCVAPNNRPYFRTYNNVTRAQTAKIIANSFFPNCQTPVRRP